MVFLLFMKATMSSQLCDELFSPREVIGKTVLPNLTEISVKWRLVKQSSPQKRLYLEPKKVYKESGPKKKRCKKY